MRKEPLVKTGKIHVVIGDTQQKPGVSNAHMGWIGQYIVDQFAGRPNVVLIHLGDHWDMPSLSSYDRGKKAMEGRRYKADIRAGNEAWDKLCEPMEIYNAALPMRDQWHPDMWILRGNHEHRISRAIEDDAKLDGTIGYHDFNDVAWGWKPVPFLEPLVLDGVTYAHYFYNPNTGRPYGGESLDTRLKTIGRSFTMGHQQGLKVAMRSVGNTRHQGLVVGSCYLHEEEYLGPQSMNYWRGIVVCHQVENGTYDPMMVSLDYLCRRYENKTIRQLHRAA